MNFVRVLDGNDHVLANYPDQMVSRNSKTSFDFTAEPAAAA
jgi:hypothetical protein